MQKSACQRLSRKMLGENYRSIKLKNHHGQEGQGNWVFSLLAASALVFSVPQVKEVVDPIRADIRAYVLAQFSTASQQSKKQPDCVMVALSHSPPVGCENKPK